MDTAKGFKNRKAAARLIRLAYSLLIPASAVVFAWRMLRLLATNPSDAAIILACVAVWAVVRMDIALWKGGGGNGR